MNRSKSLAEFAKAKNLLPGGVNSPVRSFSSINSSPVFFKKGIGSKFIDVDDNEYIDYCMSWGVLILGHAFPEISEKVKVAIDNGTTYGAPTTIETELADLVINTIPSIEKIRFVSSGTEAVMSAIRLARGYTKKRKIIKFDGCYHGHADHLLISAGSGLATFSEASTLGVPEEFIAQTISIPYNDKNALIAVFEKYKNDIAAVIIEPVAANMGVVIPENNFLELLRKITIENHSLLIFDEVITGFRLGLEGAQGMFKINPDLTTLGKIIGGGFPVGAYGGKKEIMSLISPDGPVYQAGTLSGNPVAMTAGVATIKKLLSSGFYEKLNAKSEKFFSELKTIIEPNGMYLNSISSMFTIFFKSDCPKNYTDVKTCDAEKFKKFYLALLDENIYLAPSQFEANFISLNHSEKDLTFTLEKINKVINRILK